MTGTVMESVSVGGFGASIKADGCSSKSNRSVLTPLVTDFE